MDEKTTTSARDLIRGAYDDTPNPMTPRVVRYGWSGDYAFEISQGEGFLGEPIFGVTVVHAAQGKQHALSKLCYSEPFARAYARGLRDLPAEES
jgi:hypothetical protein